MNTISNERLESLQRQFKEEGFNDISDSEIMKLVEESLALRKERERAEPIVKAAEKLVRCKGRYHSEQNYRALAALFGVTTPDLPPLESDVMREKAEPVAVVNSNMRRICKKCSASIVGYSVDGLCEDCYLAALPATLADDSLPFDSQIAEYEQMMEAEQAQADTTAQQFESLAGKAVVPEGWKLVPIEPTVEMQIAFAEAWFSKVRCVDDCELEDAYIAMLAAAPDFREISNSSTKHFRENAESSTNGWIPCSERLPEEGGRYWCYVEEINSLGKSHYQWNCSWNGEDWGGEGFYGRVTHWQPLPEPPCK